MATSSTPGDATGRRPGGSRPEAVRVDTRRVVLVGTLLWAAAAIALLPFWTWLGRHDHRVWFWTCVAGTALGVIGLMLVRRHRAGGRTD